ncbi:hypothetical protein [Cerasicoccus fimbriatus]|uniref:hypothetical protein n=1 Tax=Cerasicoccus fimbriatus TaxID=3014554 RepID=UPI0022B526CA|nr:hypothetical protein [Cerasicoccus sp. TK19100]
MNSKTPIKLLSALTLVVIGLVMAFTVSDYGVSWDETFRWSGGDAKLRYYETLFSGNLNQAAALRQQTDHYPGLFDLPLALYRKVSAAPDYLVGHAWCAFFGLLGIAGAMMLARQLSGWHAAWLAAILIALYPRYWGHSFFNPKDIPFAAAYVWGLWALARVLQTDARNARSMLLFGLLAGVCMSVRVGGLLLLCYATLFLGAQLVVNGLVLGPLTFKRQLWENARWLAGASTVALLLLLVFWPNAHQNPFGSTVDSIKEVSQFGWAGQILFAGESYAADELPRHYLPAMLARTAPDLWWWLALGCLVYLAANVRNLLRQWFTRWSVLLVVFAVCFPLAYILIRKSIVYDGARHVLFIIPPAAALLAMSSTAAYRWFKDRWSARVGLVWLVPASLLAIWTLIDMATLHPYQYIYYNRLSGGVAGANQRFETDYWGTSFREATETLRANLPVREEPWRITMEPPLEDVVARFGKPVIPPPSLVEPFLGDNIVLVRSHELPAPDFYIAIARNGYDEMRGGEPVVEIHRDGVRLAVIKSFAPAPGGANP